LSFLVLFGVALFYVVYFLRKPSRIPQLFIDLFSQSSSNKSTKMAKSFLKDAFTLVKNKLIRV